MNTRFVSQLFIASRNSTVGCLAGFVMRHLPCIPPLRICHSNWVCFLTQNWNLAHQMKSQNEELSLSRKMQRTSEEETARLREKLNDSNRERV